MSARTRAKLTTNDAVKIFQSSSIPAGKVANVYGISEKAVRDIWKGRTWAKETWHMSKTRLPPNTRIGRPSGSRDSKPRKTRFLQLNSSLTGIAAATEFPSSCTVKQMHQTPIQAKIVGFTLHDLNDLSVPKNKADNSDSDASIPIHTATIDDQLFDWEQDLRHPRSVSTLDPFRQDWKNAYKNLQISLNSD